jgi:hypothetical protein
MKSRLNLDLGLNTWEFKHGLKNKEEWKQERNKIFRLNRVRKIMIEVTK